MKVRFGVAFGTDVATADFGGYVDRLEAARIDSLWLSELVFSAMTEPFVGMAYALSRTERLKVGTSVAVLPGRHPMLVAKTLASLAGLAPRRVLPVFGLRPAGPNEAALFPVPDGQRAAVFDESLQLLRTALSTPTVDFEGRFFTVTTGRVGPLPSRPLDIWLGGSAPAGLRRIGRFADGWLGSFLTPAEAGAARVVIERAAADAGRAIDDDHYGLTLLIGAGELPAALLDSVRRRRADIDPGELVARDWPTLHRRLDGYIAGGLSKFVVRPTAGYPTDRFLDDFTAELVPRQD